MDKKIYTFAHEAMTTEFEISIAGHEKEYARQAAEEAFREIDNIELALTRFNPCSDISQINQLVPGKTIITSPYVFECLSMAIWVYHSTNKIFDISVGAVMEKLRDDDGKELHPNSNEINSALTKVNLDDLIMDSKTYKVGIKSTAKSSLILDLGGIGKGYAIDKVAELLEEWGVTNALIHGGTSTALAIGVPSENNSWILGVGGDYKNQLKNSELELKNQAISGSGTDVKGEHIINPQTGLPSNKNLATWVIHPSATIADALSTSFMLMSTDQITKYCLTNEKTTVYLVEKKSEKMIVL